MAQSTAIVVPCRQQPRQIVSGLATSSLNEREEFVPWQRATKGPAELEQPTRWPAGPAALQEERLSDR